MSHAEPSRSPRSDRALVVALTLILIAYGAATWAGWTVPHVESAAAHDDAAAASPHYWSIIPFTLLLAAIAVLPLIGATRHWWEHNLHKLYVAGNLGLLTLFYLAMLHPTGSWQQAAEVLRHTVINEYIPFIVLLFSLYTISGGIRIQGDLPAHALTNSVFITIGGLLASLIGTTGAAMLLIRPLLETNAERKHVAHTVVFFIFVVCNCGGLLLPLGDPPLFLGYLNGVDFLWTLSLWKSWLFVNSALIVVYFCWDHFLCYPTEQMRDIQRDETQIRRMTYSGLWPNVLLLGGVIASVALLDPTKTLPGTDWHPWFYLREACQLALIVASLTLGPRSVRDDNNFDYIAIVEVAALFIGIFVCMQPALQILNHEGAQLGLTSPAAFHWLTGGLSSVLDNAPTYLVFFRTAQALGSDGPSMAGVAVPLLRAISIGAVMMGAMTYIGNGPNFMVKTIAEQAGVRMPSFFGYVVYSVGVLLPILIINTLFFL